MRSGLLELISQPSNSSVYKAILQHNKATYICFRNLLFEEEKELPGFSLQISIQEDTGRNVAHVDTISQWSG